MKALVKRYAEPGLWMEEVPMPKVGVNDVLIKVTKAAICGTDLHMYIFFYTFAPKLTKSQTE